MKAILYTGVILIISMMVSSCMTDNTPPVVVESILGEWKVVDAYRNKRQTKLLNKAVVTITDTTFMTDIPPNNGPVRYAYHANEISLLNDSKISYKVHSLQNDTMVLLTELQDFEFKLILAKQIDSDEK